MLGTNAKVTPLQAVLRYRDLHQVENLFLRTKAIMRTRPIFHSSDAAIRGHVFCSFLALAMQKHLDDLSHEAGVVPEWRCCAISIGCSSCIAGRLVGLNRHDANDHGLVPSRPIVLPPRARQTAPPKGAPPSKSAHKRRGRPSHSATPPRILLQFS